MRHGLAQFVSAGALACLASALPFAAPAAGQGSAQRAPVMERADATPQLDAGFRLLYELRFPEAREQFGAWQEAHPEDALGYTSEAAGYLFEELYRNGVLTSEFFLDDKRLLGGITGKPDSKLGAEFNAANARAKDLAHKQLKSNPRDADALFALTIATGMQADYASLIQKRQLASLHLVKEAEAHARKLLELRPDSADAYLALGAANYIIGCLPGYKRAFLWFGGIRGDRPVGMQQLEIAARKGHYLRPFAKILLALAALREKQPQLARAELEQLRAEFPQNPLFSSELAKLPKPSAPHTSSP